MITIRDLQNELETLERIRAEMLKIVFTYAALVVLQQIVKRIYDLKYVLRF